MSHDTSAQPMYIMVTQPTGQQPAGFYPMPYAMPQMMPYNMAPMGATPMAYAPVVHQPVSHSTVPELDDAEDTQTLVDSSSTQAAPNTTALVILSLVIACLCNFILGLPAVLFAFKARSEHLRGDIPAARRSAKISLFFILTSVCISALGFMYIIYLMKTGAIH